MPVSWMPRKFRAKYLKPNCQLCDITDEQAKHNYGGKGLNIHHWDRNRSHNCPRNLGTLDIACHTAWHWENGKDLEDDELPQNARGSGDILIEYTIENCPYDHPLVEQQLITLVNN